MGDATPMPVRLTGLAALRWARRFVRDPLMATRRSFDAFGPFVMLAEALPFAVPFIKPQRAVLLGAPLVLTAGAAFHRELLSDTATWRGVGPLPGRPKKSASRRMRLGLTRLTGCRHAPYPELPAPPPRNNSANAMA